MSADRPLPPSPGKRQRARQEGRVARSADLTSAAVLLAGIGTLYCTAPAIFRSLAALTRDSLSSTELRMTRGQVVGLTHDSTIHWLQLCLPVLAVALFAALVSQVAQVGWMWLPSRVAPDLQRINPASGARRLLHGDRVVDVLAALGKTVLVVAVLLSGLYLYREQLVLLPQQPVPAFRAAANNIFLIALGISAALCALAIIDYGLRWWRYENSLRMTTEEAREESRGQDQANPLRQLQPGGDPSERSAGFTRQTERLQSQYE